MTVPRFRSTATFTMRQRHVAPVVDRTTFVIFSLGGQRFAASAESVERVLRNASADANGPATLEHRGQQVPVIDLRDALRPALRDALATSGVPSRVASMAPGQRTLVFSVQDQWVAATVDAVYEVATIDAALVQPVAASAPNGDAPPRLAVRGQFSRHDQVVLVLDMTRVVRAVYEGTPGAADGLQPVASASGP